MVWQKPVYTVVAHAQPYTDFDHVGCLGRPKAKGPYTEKCRYAYDHEV